MQIIKLVRCMDSTILFELQFIYSWYMTVLSPIIIKLW